MLGGDLGGCWGPSECWVSGVWRQVDTRGSPAGEEPGGRWVYGLGMRQWPLDCPETGVLFPRLGAPFAASALRTLQEEKGKLYHTQSEELGKLCGSEPSTSGQRTPEGKRGVLEGAGAATGEENSSGGPAGTSLALFPVVCPLCMVSRAGWWPLSPKSLCHCSLPQSKEQAEGSEKKWKNLNHLD